MENLVFADLDWFAFSHSCCDVFHKLQSVLVHCDYNG